VRVSAAASSEESAVRLTQSPLWTELLDRVETQISGGRRIRGSGPSSLEGTASALARAHSRLLVAIESGSKIGEGTVSQLAAEAVELVLAVARVWGTFGGRGEDRRGALVDQLRRRLSSHEDAVLAGEVTYCVWSEQAEEPAVRMRQAITRLSRDATTSEAGLLSLRTAAVDLASLLLQLAANATVGGRVGEAPEERSAALEARLSAVTAELAARTQEVKRPVDARADLVAHHLAAGLRVRVSQETLQRLSASSPDRPDDPIDLDGLRDAWLRLATNEYAAVAALDAQLETPTHNERFGSLSVAIAEGAANVICGARLAGRPEAFRHHRAWRHQAVALTYALEAYVAGLRGHAPSLAQAQRIAMTRLVRATVAIALIDLRRGQAIPSDRSLPFRATG
jgi:hypothetical protein